LMHGFKGQSGKRVADLPIARLRRSEGSAQLEKALLVAIRSMPRQRPVAAARSQAEGSSNPPVSELLDKESSSVSETPVSSTASCAVHAEPPHSRPQTSVLQHISPVAESPTVHADPHQLTQEQPTLLQEDQNEAQLMRESEDSLNMRSADCGEPTAIDEHKTDRRLRSRTPLRSRKLERQSTVDKDFAPRIEADAGSTKQFFDMATFQQFTIFASRMLHSEKEKRMCKSGLLRLMKSVYAEASVEEGLQKLEDLNKIVMVDDMVFML